MKIALLTSGIVPVPAVQGGAVETLIDFYLDYNNRHHLHDITVYSVYHPNVDIHPALRSEVNHYRYIKTDTLMGKLRKRLYKWKNPKGYYYYTIEYFANQVANLLKKEHYDMILIENRPGYALQLANKTNARLVYHLHNGKLDTTVAHHQEIYDAASRIISVSDFITNRVKTINPQDTKCVTVHNGIDLKAFHPNSQSAISRDKLNFEEDDFVMAFNGKVNPEKGLMELVQAMKLLSDYPKIKLMAMGSTFYGANTYNDHPYAAKLLNEAKPVQQRITFTSFVPYEKIPDYLRLADVSIIPSVWDDPFPTTVLEAQALGLPIITTRRGGIPEEVSEANAILLNTDEHFVENLAATILNLYENPEKRNLMATASAGRAKLFEKDMFARNFFAALENA